MRKIHIFIMISFFSMWIWLFFQNILGFFLSAVLVAVFIVFGHDVRETSEHLCRIAIYMKNYAYSMRSSKILKITKFANDPIISLVKPITDQKTLSAIRDKIGHNLVFLVRRSGRNVSPRTLAYKSTAYAVFSFFVVVPLAVFLGIVLNLFFFFMIVVPLVVFFLPLLGLRFRSSERKSTIEDELVFFAVYGCIMQTVGRSLYASISQVIGKKIFPSIELEGIMLRRNVALFGMDQISALNSLAISHPTTQFRNLLLGYVSIQKSGGDLGLYMEKRSEEFFSEAKFRFFRYASSAETIAETALILLSVLPVLFVMSSFLMSEDALRVLMSLSFVAMPAITTMLIIVINNVQPKIRDSIGFSYISLAVGAVTGIAVFFFVQEAWFALAVAVFVSSVTNFVFLSNQFAEISMAERALADFFRDITEYRKIGVSIPNAIIKISKERTYNRFFDQVLLDISSRISYGIELTKITDALSIRSWHTRVSFFILAKIADSGGGTPKTLEQITDFATRIIQAKNEMVGRIRVFTFLACGSPLLMVWSSQAMKDLLERITPEYARLMSGAGNGLIISDEFFQMVNLLMVISSLCIGMIISKTTHFTMKHTLTTGVTSLVAMISVYLMQYLPSL